MAHTAQELPTYPMRRPDPLRPPPEFASLRAEQPVCKVKLWDGNEAWLVTSYELAREVYKDTRFSSVPAKPGYPHLSPGSTVLKKNDNSLLRMDPPEHRVHRKMLVPEFSPRRSESYMPAIRTAVSELIQEMCAQEPPVDLVKHFALPVPSVVICELLGVPYEYHEEFHLHSKIRVSQSSSVEEVDAANNALYWMVDKLVSEKERQPGSDLISRLVTGSETKGKLSHDEIVTMGVLVLFAGHETTANMLSLSVLTLLKHEDQLAELRGDPTMWPEAVEELMRYLSIAHVSPVRAATVDTELGGQLIRAGDGVIVPPMAANWDPKTFPEPERFDIHRKEARNQIGFGYGVHQCVGQTLARLELHTALQALFEGMPRLRLAAEVGDLPFKYDALFYGLYELPVAW